MRPCQWWTESAPLGWNRVNVSENLDATAVAQVAPVDTSLPFVLCLLNNFNCLLKVALWDLFFWTQPNNFVSLFFRRYSWRLLKRRFNCYSLHFSCFGFISHCSLVFAFGPNIVETILKSFGARKPGGLGAFRSSWRWTGTRFGYAKIIHTFLQVSFFLGYLSKPCQL